MQNLLNVRITDKKQIAKDICVLKLAPASAEPLPFFSAGAHVDIHLATGIVRQYSLCNTAAQQDVYVIAVLRETESRGGSTAVHDKLEVGDIIKISEPRNHFSLVQSATSSLLVAGGIGITPLLRMAEELNTMGAAFGLHYCARSKDRMAFRDYLLSCDYSKRVHLHVDDGPDDQKLDLQQVVSEAGPDAQLYVCGPSGFIDWVLKGAQMAGVDASRLHREYFSPQHVSDGQLAPFEIIVASTGQKLRVPPGKSAANVLIEAGVSLTVSCEEGICGSCITGILEGTPDHRDSVFTDEERERGDRFTPCCSRAKSSRLVLDL
ncbi:PDR/VanB family oxidoreductase [Bradyrhizobium sp. TM239]|uniref:PDR/VanB family oxidoreductase n=1 Tax=Bradyrhizobium sp. TM239 TaxID=2599802 RepID=UPI0030C72869